MLYYKAICLSKIGYEALCEEILKQSYHCYMMLGKHSKAHMTLENAKTVFGVDIIKVDVGKDFYCLTLENIKSGDEKIRYCKNISNLLKEFQNIAGVKQNELCKGICNKGNYSKIEKEKVDTNFFSLEVFIQRLGRNIDQYIDTFLSADEFKIKQLKREINALLALRKSDEAESLLNQIKDEKIMQISANTQFLKSSYASVMYNKEGYTEQYLQLVIEALKVTIPDFDEINGNALNLLSVV